MDYLRPGDLCAVWEPCSMSKEFWVYLHHDHGVPVFVNKWPIYQAEGYCSLSLDWLQYKFIMHYEEWSKDG